MTRLNSVHDNNLLQKQKNNKQKRRSTISKKNISTRLFTTSLYCQLDYISPRFRVLSLRSVAIINLCHKKTANLNNRPPPPRKSPSPRPQQLTWTWEGQQQQGRSTHEHRRRSGRRRVKLHYIDIIINSKDTLISKECPQGQGPSVVQLANGASSTHTLTRE